MTASRLPVFLIWSILALSTTVKCENSVSVNTHSGKVIGFPVSVDGVLINRFLGIPFAEPPVGNLRFRRTAPVKPWTAPFIADKMSPSCMQHYPFNYPWVDQMPGKSEDCLTLNIWAPVGDNPKAVMFWIFSGGFTTGSNRQPVYDGQVLAAKGDVIVVSINYRLGIFGLLSSDSDEAPGNQGLYDILEALKWVNKNIESFGGDSKRITVFGHSEGSMIGGLLTVSPLARGLFQRTIMESAALMPTQREKNLKLGDKIAKVVGCASESSNLKTSPNAVIGCLRKVDAQTLLNASSSILGTSIESFSTVSGDPFEPIEPTTALRRGLFNLDIDVMIGIVQDETSFLLASADPDLCGPYGEKNPRIDKIRARGFINDILGLGNSTSLEIADYFLSSVPDDDYDTIRSQTWHAIDGMLINCPAFDFARQCSWRGNNVYTYYYDQQSHNTVFADWLGVTHFSEVPFVFGRPLDHPDTYTEEEQRFSQRIMQYWTNFAKHGFPDSGWKKYSGPSYHIQKLHINKNSIDYLPRHLKNCEFLNKYRM